MTWPEGFVKRMEGQLGVEACQTFFQALQAEAPISIRLNPKKFHLKTELETVPWASNGRYLSERPNFASDPLWHAGAYYVQEASSMYLEQVFSLVKSKFNEPIKVLDLCAAPGGKSTHLLAMCNHDDVVVSNEVIKSRVGVLLENIRKLGYYNSIVCHADSSDFAALGPLFNVIVVDAPCSGEGLFRKDPQAINEWSDNNIQTCELRQQRILDQIQQCLLPGGYLIYSTCTYNPGENQVQMERLMQNGFTPVAWTNQTQKDFQWQCYPHQIKGEGFYIALLQKQNSTLDAAQIKPKYLKPVKPFDELPKGLNTSDVLVQIEETIHLVPQNTLDLYENALYKLHCVGLGSPVGSFLQKRFSPSEHLPFSLGFNAQEYPIQTLDQTAALNYLSKQILPYQGNQKGLTVIQYKGCNLGWGKFAGNRINNLFPAEWKLRLMPKTEQFFSLDNW
jgi:16S rRNA C967 or C1407 C5-methylase (RsmB/RsmF family)/NOL1/NOP2/fmu family ribosome biogenesis protein